MRELAVVFVIALLVAAQLPLGLTLPSTVPAFLWSPHHDGFSSNGLTRSVNYQTLSPKDLAKFVLSEGGWSDFLCSEKGTQRPVDLALLFVGRELRSSDISVLRQVDSSIVDSIKASFVSANHSLAFPYVAASEKEETMESSLVSEFAETCGHELASKVTISKSCFLDGGEYEQLDDLDSVNDYLASRMEKKQKGQADLVVFCQEGSASEGKSFTDILSSAEQSGSRYTALYVSDPLRSKMYPTYQEVARFLGESISGNASSNSTGCDGVCQIKSSLLEGLLVGIVLLLILISGLCCMAGIDTPTRFEVPQDS